MKGKTQWKTNSQQQGEVKVKQKSRSNRSQGQTEVKVKPKGWVRGARRHRPRRHGTPGWRPFHSRRGWAVQHSCTHNTTTVILSTTTTKMVISFENVSLVESMYPVFIACQVEWSYRRQLGSPLLCVCSMCDVNSLSSIDFPLFVDWAILLDHEWCPVTTTA